MKEVLEELKKDGLYYDGKNREAEGNGKKKDKKKI